MTVSGCRTEAELRVSDFTTVGVDRACEAAGSPRGTEEGAPGQVLDHGPDVGPAHVGLASSRRRCPRDSASSRRCARDSARGKSLSRGAQESRLTQCIQAGTDDIIPLSAPMTLPNGQTTDHVFVAAGQHVAVPIITVNRMKSLWGEDGYEVRRGQASD
jgi:hypothetical protein